MFVWLRNNWQSRRFLWSTAWGTLAVLLLLLWWRSYWTLDLLTRVDSRRIETTIGSQFGAIYFAHFDAYKAYVGTGNPYESHGWRYRTLDSYVLKRQFEWERGTDSLNVTLPHWVFVLAATIVSGMVWCRMRFSVRTLLIATALVSLVLGLTLGLK